MIRSHERMHRGSPPPFPCPSPRFGYFTGERVCLGRLLDPGRVTGCEVFLQGLWSWVFFPYLMTGLGTNLKQRFTITEFFIIPAVATYYVLHIVYDAKHISHYPRSFGEQSTFALLYIIFGTIMAVLFSIVAEVSRKRNLTGLFFA